MALIPKGAAGDDDSEGEGEEEEEESEEAQMCWSALFSFFPLIWTVVAEFAAAIYEAVKCTPWKAELGVHSP